MKYLSVKQAASEIGCSIRHVQTLVNQKDSPFPSALKDELGMYWLLPIKEVRAYARTEQNGGWPRGKKRT